MRNIFLYTVYVIIMVGLLVCGSGRCFAKKTDSEKLKDFIILVVDKKELKATLMTWPDNVKDAKTLSTFQIAIGKESGDKTRRGDNKTPEGIYLTESILTKDQLNPKYGPMAITLDYPNPMDRVEKKTGHGIWLHGVINNERVQEAHVTEGCVAFYNDDIIKLADWLKPQQGIVIITDGTSGVNKVSDVDAIRRSTELWGRMWSQRNIDGYMNQYASSFRYEGRNKDQYRDYKKSIFSSYRNMDVKLSSIKVFVHSKYAVSMMNQEFHGDRRSNFTGRKTLYWIKEGNEWKIRREMYDPYRVADVEYSFNELNKLKKTGNTKTL